MIEEETMKRTFFSFHLDFLLNHREIISKHSHWFNDDIKPMFDDSIYFKQCQLKSLN